MRLFSVSQVKDKTEEKTDAARRQLVGMTDAIANHTRELNNLREEIKKETREKKRAIQEEIAPLLRELEEARAALASAEIRKREMWVPFKHERDVAVSRDRKLMERETEFREKTAHLLRQEEYIRQRKADADKAFKENRQNTQLLRRSNKKAETLVSLQTQTLRDIEKEKEYLQKAEASLQEKEAYLSKREEKLAIDKNAAFKLIRDKEKELQVLSKTIEDDRKKLKSAIDFARDRYAIRSKGSE